MPSPNDGARAHRSGWLDGQPRANLALAGAIAAAFVAQAAAARIAPGQLERLFALDLRDLLAGQPWRAVTYMFLHGGILHLAANLITLLFVGRHVAPAVGTLRFLILFFAGGLAGGAAQLVAEPRTSLIGASAGVCALLAAFTRLAPDARLTMLLFFFFPVRLACKHLLWATLALCVALPALGLLPGWAHFAHLGGTLAGWGLMELFIRRPRGNNGNLYKNQQIDSVLDKVLAHGLHSLSKSERALLEAEGRKNRAPRPR